MSKPGEKGQASLPEVVMKERKTPGVSVRMTLLPESFEPSEHDVLCGRGSVCKNWPGTLAYRQMVRSKLQEYSVANTKQEKGAILDGIVKEVRQRSKVGGFIKKDQTTQRYYEVGDFLAREKTSQCFRDALHEQYTSSAHAKYKRRKQQSSESGGSPKKAAKTSTSQNKHAAYEALVRMSTTDQIQAQGTQNPKELMALSAFQNLARANDTQFVHSAASTGLPSLSPPQIPPAAAAASNKDSILRARLEEMQLRLASPLSQGLGLHPTLPGATFPMGLPSLRDGTSAPTAASILSGNLAQRAIIEQQIARLGAASATAASHQLSRLPFQGPNNANNNSLDSQVLLLQQMAVASRLNNAPSPSSLFQASLDRAAAQRALQASQPTRTLIQGEVKICALQPRLRAAGESPLDATKQVLKKIDEISLQHHVDLFILPELSPVGYSADTFARFLPNTPEMQSLYHQIDFAFASHACKLQAYISYGTIGWKQCSDGSQRFFIRQKVVDRSGQIVSINDKAHLFDYNDCHETRYFAPASSLPSVFAINGLRFGTLLSADMRYADLCRSLVRDQQADVLLQPSAGSRDTSFRSWKSFRETRAVENSIYLVGVNYAGMGNGETTLVPPWVDGKHEPQELACTEGFLIGKIERQVLNHVRTTMPFYRHLMEGQPFPQQPVTLTNTTSEKKAPEGRLKKPE